MKDDEFIAWVRLSRTEGIGPITFRKLIQKYKSAHAAIDALPHVSTKKFNIFSFDKAKEEIEKTLSLKGKMLTLLDMDYPALLKQIDDAPPVISVLGSTDILKRPSIGIVGSRNSSLNARKLSYALAQNLGGAGYAIASGLARGIDTSAHEGSLASGTIAVIAGGVDVVYPPENKNLYDKIIENNGAIISEAPLTMQPLATHFPKRNRIITGLSQGVVVVEANERSGSLISARTAGEQGRAVMAVPGFPIDPRSTGTNDLIRNGAVLVRNADDVLEELQNFRSSFGQTLNLFSTRVTPLATLCEEEDFEVDLAPPPDFEEIRDILLNNISISPSHIDEIIRACQLNSQDVQSTLFELELSGLVQRLPGNRICRIA